MSAKKKEAWRERNMAAFGAGTYSSGENYAKNVKLNARMGHGFAAESANDFADSITGHTAKIIGDDNALNGADRLVDGVEIQSKYCRTGYDCIKECFDENGFRYMSRNGKPMKIEVPSDKYDEAVRAMRNKISEGKIPGITNPDKAESIVQKGSVTYEQAKNIAKFGTVDGLIYDAAHGISTFGTAFGVSSLVAFARGLWNGEDLGDSLKNACYEGIRIGGISMISGVISAQISRTGIEMGLRPATDTLVKFVGSKAAHYLSTVTHSGSELFGSAAINHASKLLRGNVVTAVVTTAVLSSVDVARMFSGKMSGAQLFKNVARTATGVAGGAAGWAAGAAAGAALGSAIPFLGTAVGGILGGLVGAFGGGTASTAVASTVLDEFIEDDAKEMMRIVQSILEELSINYMLSENECNEAIDRFKNRDIADYLRNMYASSNRRGYANSTLESIVESIAQNRARVRLPSNEDILETVGQIIEENETI